MMYPAAMEQTVTDPPLTLMDRCDRCGAEAKHRHRFATGELLMCGHHDRQFAAKMLEKEIS